MDDVKHLSTFFPESSEGSSGHSEMDQSMDSESDTYFASLSGRHKSNSTTMTLNLSFSGISQISPIKPKSPNCDNELSSSGVSLSSPNMSDSARPSPSSSHPFIPKSPLGISGHSSHIWRRSSSRKCKTASDSDCDSPRKCERQGSTSYMTLRRTTKRKSRRSVCASSSYVCQSWCLSALVRDIWFCLRIHVLKLEWVMKRKDNHEMILSCCIR